jgi:hypothetical protein
MPLTRLTHKGAAFSWNEQYEQAFQKLKVMFIEAPILVRFDPDLKIIVKTDSSGWCIGGILLQL